MLTHVHVPGLVVTVSAFSHERTVPPDQRPSSRPNASAWRCRRCRCPAGCLRRPQLRSTQTFLVERLREHLGDAAPDTPVFPAPQGRPMRHSNFYQRIVKPTVRTTLPQHLHAVRFHDLRHTNAALLIAEGGHPKAIQQRLGHSSITVTLDRYGHQFPPLDDALADALDATYRTMEDARRSLSGPSDDGLPEANVVDLWSANEPRANEQTTKTPHQVKCRAGSRIRTGDLRFTRALL